MINILLGCQASFRILIIVAVVFVKRSVVRLQAVFFWSRLRLFANQTDVFTIELDKKYSSSHLNWNILAAALCLLDSAIMKKLN